jgi:hypothetical protein
MFLVISGTNEAETTIPWIPIFILKLMILLIEISWKISSMSRESLKIKAIANKYFYS